MVCHHLAELPLQDQLHSLAAKARRKRAVERRRRAPSLQMPQYDVARLLAGQLPQPLGAADAFAAESLGISAMRLLEQRRLPVLRVRALGNHDDAEAGAPGIAVADALCDPLEVVRNLRHQDDVRAAGHTAV